MKINFIAFDSLGVKSSCTQVRTKDVTITIDPGIADEVDSFPLPHGQRCDLAGKYDERIRRACSQSDIVAITHYHYDHFIDEGDKRLYGGKILLIKHPKNKINHSQEGRAASFLPKAEKLAKEIHFADGKEFRFGSTIVRFSKPQWHGPQGTNLGFVLMVSVIEGKEKLLYTSDLNGVYLREQADSIIKEKPTFLILDGFPTYLLGYVASFANFKKAIENTVRIIEHTRCRWYVIDHHLLRDYRYPELYWEVYKKAKRLGKRVCTAAEMLGEKPAVLRAYEKNGPTRWVEWEDFSFQKLNKLIAGARKKAGAARQ
ncbi:MAG: MBL fold metallo-hydrolase [Candidatus Diapherotrites archaeon]|nr:MBL fold metallo-hydrolase [Candidatus Diapherotrites archaeon]